MTLGKKKIGDLVNRDQEMLRNCWDSSNLVRKEKRITRYYMNNRSDIFRIYIFWDSHFQICHYSVTKMISDGNLYQGSLVYKFIKYLWTKVC